MLILKHFRMLGKKAIHKQGEFGNIGTLNGRTYLVSTALGEQAGEEIAHFELQPFQEKASCLFGAPSPCHRSFGRTLLFGVRRALTKRALAYSNRSSAATSKIFSHAGPQPSTGQAKSQVQARRAELRMGPLLER